LLEGKNVNLRVVEREDLPLCAEWFNNPEINGEYEPLLQASRTELEKWYSTLGPKEKWFFIEKKDGTKMGIIRHAAHGWGTVIGAVIIPSERGKGYCTEAVKIMVDYLFLSKDIVRIQARTNQQNMASQKVLEKAGFKKEGTMRKSSFSRGKWIDMLVYSILKEEWKEPKILTQKKG
jgi:ribosomal-protein-alanine N-acetyltransferase